MIYIREASVINVLVKHFSSNFSMFISDIRLHSFPPSELDGARNIGNLVYVKFEECHKKESLPHKEILNMSKHGKRQMTYFGM